MPPHYDAIPFERVAELIGDAEPSRQSAALHEAWRDYSARAVHPYAWSTFAKYARDHVVQSGGWSPKRAKGKLNPWKNGAPASPRVLVLGAYAALRVRGGGLEIEHGAQGERTSLRFDVDAETKPQAILFDSHGEFLTGEAIRFCARHSITLILPGGPGRLITTVETFAETRDIKGASKRDINPKIILAQCAAALDERKTTAIAREIVQRKIEAEAFGLTAFPEARKTVADWATRLGAAETIPAIITIEAHAAAAYWRVFRDIGLRERKGGGLPRSWMRFPQRNRGRPAFREGVGGGPKNASHPINAMLNYAYVVEAGRLARALTARGLILPLGFLHKAKRGRNSLVWDAIEPLRPVIDAKVFEFVASHEFARADFPQAGLRVFRLSRELTQLLLHNVSLPSRDIEDAVEWLATTIMRFEKSRQ
jgi:CRISPR-associated endonuclease Cas1